MPPPAEGFVARLLVGPALRAQPDRRLVTLVREGYEAAFEEIVRRYGPALRRYAGGIAGGSAEDVTQDALSKALVALRRDDNEIELRPWLYRIVRNTALNDLRDRPPRTATLSDRVATSQSVAEEIEQREEIDEVIGRLQALPETQRAAIVMRELEGLSHEEIAVALGVSGGAARQAIHRARTALRGGFGLAIPLPLLRLMLESGGTPAAEVAAGGAGAGVVLKAATAAVLVVGTLGAGAALHHAGRGGRAEASSESPTAPASRTAGQSRRELGADDASPPGSAAARGHSRSSGPDSHDSHRGDSKAESGNDGHREGSDDGPSSGHGGPSGDDDGNSGSSHGSGGNSGPSGGSSGPDDGGESNSGPDSSGGEGPSGEESEKLSDSGDGEGFSSQTQPPIEEDR